MEEREEKNKNKREIRRKVSREAEGNGGERKED